jgi:hypothetical protein
MVITMFSVKENATRLQELIDHISRAFQSLMVAHGAGLLASLSVLRDYATTSAYKGIGIPISLFSFGLISALCGYCAMLLVNFE